MPEITFHCLRQTHVSQLIAEGVNHRYDLQTSRYAKPNVTLAIYAHMFKSDDGKAAAAINAALNR